MVLRENLEAIQKCITGLTEQAKRVSGEEHKKTMEKIKELEENIKQIQEEARKKFGETL